MEKLIISVEEIQEIRTRDDMASDGGGSGRSDGGTGGGDN